jgi:hypothetical protein
VGLACDRGHWPPGGYVEGALTTRSSPAARKPTHELDRTGRLAPPIPAVARERRFLDLVLTAPIFVVYHLGVVFLDVRNGLDPITDLMLAALERSLLLYLGVTLFVGLALAIGVRIAGLTRAFHPARFGLRIGEAILYAIAMAVVAKSVAAYTLGPKGVPTSPLASVILSFGAGFYEEIAFRVILFGAGAWFIRRSMRGLRAVFAEIVWALVAAFAFSAIHYVGALSDPFRLGSFVFRATCGVVLTLIYRLRGFAAAVWTHALYDVGVMVF